VFSSSFLRATTIIALDRGYSVGRMARSTKQEDEALPAIKFGIVNIVTRQGVAG
jgi:hypothetical protein